MAQIKKIQNKKGVSYQAVIRKKNYKDLYKTFKKKSDAEAWAKDVETQMDKGIYIEEKTVIIDSKKFETMEQLITYFKKEIAPTHYEYAEKYDVMYDWWIAHIGNIKITQLTFSHINNAKRILMTEKIHKKTGEQVRGNSTINKYLMCLSAVLTHASRTLEIIPYNPMSKKDFTLPNPDGRTRFLSDKEKKLFAERCKNKSKVVFIFFLLLIQTGGRYSEVLYLRVEHIDIKNSRVHFINTKNNTNRGVGICRELLNLILEYLKENNIESGYIFFNKAKNKFIYMRGHLMAIIQDAGLENFRIHDFRHTFASKSAEEGASLLDISILLGHKSLVMARRYSHLTQQHTDKIARQTAISMNLDITFDK